MKSLDELKELRKKAQNEMKNRSDSENPEVIIGMGTCGISAGARDILKAVMDEVDKRDLDVIISQTGCIGMCEKEPLMDVRMPGKQRITYGELKPENAREIIASHIINGKIVEDFVIARHEQ